MSASRIRHLVRVGIVTDVLLVSWLFLALFLDWGVMTKLLLVSLGVRALSWCFLRVAVKKSRQL